MLFVPFATPSVLLLLFVEVAFLTGAAHTTIALATYSHSPGETNTRRLQRDTLASHQPLCSIFHHMVATAVFGSRLIARLTLAAQPDAGRVGE